MTSNSGRARSKSASSPPAMIVSVPSSALGDDPVTGASTKPMPRSSSAAPIRRVSAGAIVDMSTHSVPSPARVGDAVLAEQDRLDLGAVHDHRDHDVARRADLGRRVGDGRAVLGGERLGSLAGAVEDRELVARAPQVRGHARPHDPQPDEPDALHGAAS